MPKDTARSGVPRNPGGSQWSWRSLLARTLILWSGRPDDVPFSASSHRNLAADLYFEIHRSAPLEVRGVSRTDHDAALDWFLDQYPTVLHWYEALIEPPDVSIDWRNGQPLIAPRTVVQWEVLANHLDVDVLLCLHLARHIQYLHLEDSSQELLRHLPGWKTVACVGDHELSLLWARGLSDMHVHTGGVRLSPAAWRQLMDRNLDHHTHRLLGHAHDESVRAGYGIGSFDSFRRTTRDLRSEIAKAVGEYSPPAPGPMPADNGWWRWSIAHLRSERGLLISAWRKLLEPGVHFDFQARFDKYLRAKHHFARLARQPIFSEEPGLRAFEHYFRVLKPAQPQHYGTSPQRLMWPYGDACVHLLESDHLRRIELRMAPLDSMGAYGRFFSRWNELKGALADYLRSEAEPTTAARTMPEIRFAIHFKRTRRATKGDGSDIRRKMADADRESAALRAALNDPGYHSDVTHGSLLHDLRRIDLAGQERDSAASQFAMHMRLLRGDPDAMACLEAAQAGHPCAAWLTKWLDLATVQDHRPALGQRRLGMTVHAGEDFADLLDGIYQIDSAIEDFALGPGDSIGHGLALGSDVGPPEAVARAMMPRGEQHDSLCWLYDLLEDQDRSSAFMWARAELRVMIERTGQAIYETHGELHCDNFRRLRRHRIHPALCEWEELERDPAMQQLILRSFNDESLLLRREALIPLDPARATMAVVIEWARNIVLEKMKSKRIVVELNPASNLRVSGVSAIEKSPTVRLLLEVNNGLLACINTDNPAVFWSRIENEYALLLEGVLRMREGEHASRDHQAEARDLLETVRRIGMEVLY